MYSVSEIYKNQIKEPNNLFDIRLRINDQVYGKNNVLTGSLTISKKCSENNKVSIGSVFISELTATLKDIDIIDWDNAEIYIEEGLKLPDGSYEYIPLGIFNVTEAYVSTVGWDITAYDDMAKFDKSCDVDVTTGLPYDLLVMACNKCDVTFGMTRSMIEDLPNGSNALVLYGDNDIETWRDYISWLAQTCACFATINRSGELRFVQYGQTVVNDIDYTVRFQGCKFSNFETIYSGISVVNIEDQNLSYYGMPDDKYLTYNLGSNPFLQNGPDTNKENLRRNVLLGLQGIRYVPFESSVQCGALYDLGDVIQFRRGIADETKISCIMSWDYTFNKEVKLEGYGSNPALASAKNKTDKNLVGLANNIKNKDFIFYVYENAEAYNVSDGSSVDIIDIRFTSASAMYVIFQAEVLLEIDTTVIGDTYDDAVAKVSYILNSSEIEYFHPTETYVDGKHILHLANVFSIDVNAVNRLVVTLNMDGGDAHVPAQAIRAAIYGQGLAASVEWDGFLDFSETVSDIPFSNMTIDTISENVIFDFQNPIWHSISETVSDILLSNMSLDTITEDLTAYITEHSYINEDNVPLYDDTAVEYSEGAYRVIEGANVPQELIKKMIDVDELVDITSLTVDGTNITLQFSDDGETWKSYVNSNWIETTTEMTVNQASALTIEDWIKLTTTTLWVKVSLNVTNSYLAEMEIEYIEGVGE